jgi:DNA-binding NarL/FixJ family response regulator
VVLEIGPRAVSRTVLVRLARLPEDAIAVARAVAVLAESATLPTVAALSGLSEARVADATGGLARAEILRPESPLGFVHALVRDAVYQELPLGERELQHERAARVLLDAGAPAEHVAAHLLTAPRRGQEWVAQQLREAGRAAVTRGAPESGVAQLRRALEEPAPADWRPELLMELGLAEGLMDGPAAVGHLTEAYEGLADPAARAQVAHALSRALLFTGSPVEGAAFAHRAADELPDELEDDRRGLTAFELAAGYFGVGGPETLRRLDAHRAPPPPGAGVGAKMLAAPAALWWGYCGEGSADECAELALAALAGGQLTAADNGLLSLPGIVTLVLADRREADAAWEYAQVEAHRRGSLHAVSSIHLWHGFTLMLQGELVEAEESLRQGQEEFDAWGFGAVATIYTGAFRCRALTERGRLDEARSALDRGRPMLDDSDGGRYWRAALLELLVAEGRDAEAVELSQDITRRHGHVVLPTSAHWRSATSRALDRLGRHEEAIELAEVELADARRWGAPGTIGPSLRILGMLRREDGTALLEEAVTVLERSHARLELAKALADLGTALRRDRRPSDAREPLRRALELADACGADALVEHVRSELYATGARPRTTALGGVDSLTASERRVAAFAADGQSNRDIAQALFVTPKTVEVHLSNAYRKLGIRSRRDLAVALAGR